MTYFLLRSFHPKIPYSINFLIPSHKRQLYISSCTRRHHDFCFTCINALPRRHRRSFLNAASFESSRSLDTGSYSLEEALLNYIYSWYYQRRRRRNNTNYKLGLLLQLWRKVSRKDLKIEIRASSWFEHKLGEYIINNIQTIFKQ